MSKLQVVQDNRAPIYQDADGRYVMRFSGFGHCTKELVAWGMEMEGADYSKVMLHAFEEGRENEPAVLSHFASGQDYNKFKLLDPEDQESYVGAMPYVKRAEMGQFCAEIPVGKNIVLRGHLDGLGMLYARKSDYWLQTRQVVAIEAKALGKSMYGKYAKGGLDVFPGYKMQVALTMHATGLPLAFVVGIKDDEPDENGIRRVIGFKVDWFIEPPIQLGVIKARALKLARMIDDGDLPEACDIEQFPCPFFFLHDRKEEMKKKIEGAVECPREDVLELEQLVRDYQQASVDEKTSKDWKAAIGAKIKGWFGEHGADTGGKALLHTGTVPGTRTLVTLQHQKVKERTQTIKAHTRVYPTFSEVEMEGDRDE